MFVVLNMDTVKAYLSQTQIDIRISEQLVNSPEYLSIVYRDLMAVAAHHKLNSLEKPKQIKILVEPFTVENDLLTPTFKIKRDAAK